MVRLLSDACVRVGGSGGSDECRHLTAADSVRDSSLDITCILLSLSI